VADFESRLGDLESIVERLEKGDLPLEESVRLFEEGIKLSESCK
jgi:exodeoxyribonuclease VII small subunit